MMATDDNPPVGVILCSDKNQTKVQFATAGLDNQLFVSRGLEATTADADDGAISWSSSMGGFQR
jgi:hypothetical protein